MLVPDLAAAGGERVELLDFGIAKPSEELSGGDVRTRSNVWGSDGGNVWVVGSSGVVFQCSGLSCETPAFNPVRAYRPESARSGR